MNKFTGTRRNLIFKFSLKSIFSSASKLQPDHGRSQTHFASVSPVVALTEDLVLILEMIDRDGLLIVCQVTEFEQGVLAYPFIVEDRCAQIIPICRT